MTGRTQRSGGQSVNLSNEFHDYLRENLKRRIFHRMSTDKPYEECECSEGGKCQPKDPAQRPVLRGIE